VIKLKSFVFLYEMQKADTVPEEDIMPFIWRNNDANGDQGNQRGLDQASYANKRSKTI
jgi:hypothetical protein